MKGDVKYMQYVGLMLILLLAACSDKQYSPMSPHAKVYGSEIPQHTSSDTLTHDNHSQPAVIDEEKESILFSKELVEMFPSRIAMIEKVVQQSPFVIKNINDDIIKNDIQTNEAVFHLLANISFPSGESLLLPQQQQTFSALALALQKDGSRSVLIVGHSDSSGNMYTNRRLSVQRAKAIADIFVNAGFSPTQIFFQGVGEYEPVQSNKTKSGRDANRRIEIIEAHDFSHLAKIRLQAIKKSKASKSVLSATMLLKNMKGQFYVLAMHSKYFQASIQGHAFTGQRLVKYGLDTSIKKKKKTLLSAFSSFFEVHAEKNINSIHSHISNILGDSVKGNSARLRLTQVQGMAESNWQLGYEAKVAPLAAMLPHGKHLDIPAFPISKDGVLMLQTPPLKFYASQNSTTARAVFKGYDKLYRNESSWLYRWKSNDKTLMKSGFIGLDILLKSFDDRDFNETHIEKLQGLLYYVDRGEIMVAAVSVRKRLFKKEKITIDYLKSFLPI